MSERDRFADGYAAGRKDFAPHLPALADRIEALEAALDLAVNIIMVNEPGDSRAVSDEAVALAAVSCGDTSPEVMAVIRAALAAEQKK